MKFIIISLLVKLALALPATEFSPSTLEERQTLIPGETSNDLLNGGPCPQVMFIYARASTEGGNLGILGGPIGRGMNAALGAGTVGVQGVGGVYTAGLPQNFLPAGTTQLAIAEMTRLFNLADTQCPNATMVAGGYSQGTALAAAAVGGLDPAVQAKVAGTVLFGYTKNLQNGGQIPNYPAEKTMVFCNPGDLVCKGTLTILPPHLLYMAAASGPGVDFLVKSVNAAT